MFNRSTKILFTWQKEDNWSTITSLQIKDYYLPREVHKFILENGQDLPNSTECLIEAFCLAKLTPCIRILVSAMYHVLFQPTTALLETVTQIQRQLNLQPGQPYTAIHFRLGSGLTWSDPQRHSMNQLSKWINAGRSLTEAFGNNSSVKSSTIPIDSQAAKNEASKLMPGIRMTKIEMFHIDIQQKPENQSRIGTLETFAEFTIMMQATCAVQSVSVFSAAAAIAGRTTTRGCPWLCPRSNGG